MVVPKHVQKLYIVLYKEKIKLILFKSRFSLEFYFFPDNFVTISISFIFTERYMTNSTVRQNRI